MSDSSRRHPAIQILVDLVADLRKTDGTLAKLEEAWPRLDAGEGDRGDELPFWTSFHDEVLQKAENLAKKQNVIRSDTVSQGVLSFLQRLPELVESEASEFADPDEPGTLDVVLRAVQQEIEVLEALAENTWPLRAGQNEEDPRNQSSEPNHARFDRETEALISTAKRRLSGVRLRLFIVLVESLGDWVSFDGLDGVFTKSDVTDDTIERTARRLGKRLDEELEARFSISCSTADRRLRLELL